MELKSGMVRAHQDDGIGWLVFDNPAKRNAISQEMRADALAVAEAYEADPAVKVVIMRGAGEKAFISGGDISKFDKARGSTEANRNYSATSQQLQNRLLNSSKPVIAMIYGYCLGGGMGVALAADMRFASSDCQLGIPAALRGIAYGADGLKKLVDLVGPSRAKDIMFSGRRIGGEEALQLGLVNRIFPAETLESETVAYARLLASNAPLSIRASKYFINQLGLEKKDRDEERMAAMVDAAGQSEDFKEATRAFMEKRKPVFRGV